MTTVIARNIGAGVAGELLVGATHAQKATEVWRTTGCSNPESVEWDLASGLFYVPNMGADPMAKDGDGYIATMGADGAIRTDKWVTGLDAPKGMAIQGGKIVTIDIVSWPKLTPHRARSPTVIRRRGRCC